MEPLCFPRLFTHTRCCHPPVQKLTCDTANDFLLVHLSSFSFHKCFSHNIPPFLRMRKSFQSILCTAYCDTIMPQIDYNVDNICNTVILKVVICMKSSFEKRLITVPVSHFHHAIMISPTSTLTMLSWAVVSHRRIVNCLWLVTKGKQIKKGPEHC